MLAAILRNEVGWFDEGNNSGLVATCLTTDAADVKSAIAERISQLSLKGFAGKTVKAHDKTSMIAGKV